MHFDTLSDLFRYWRGAYQNGDANNTTPNSNAYDTVWEVLAQGIPTINAEDFITTFATPGDTAPEMDGDMPELDNFLSQFADE